MDDILNQVCAAFWGHAENAAEDGLGWCQNGYEGSFDEFLRRHRHSLLGGEVTAGNIIRLVLGIAVGLGGGFILIGLGIERLTRPGGAHVRRLFGLLYGSGGFVLLYSGLGFAFSSSLDGWSALYRGLLLPL